jgi:hypothetical protein
MLPEKSAMPSAYSGEAYVTFRHQKGDSFHNPVSCVSEQKTCLSCSSVAHYVAYVLLTSWFFSILKRHTLTGLFRTKPYNEASHFSIIQRVA